MICQYPNCKKEAEYRLRLADPDSEGTAYCEEHLTVRKMELCRKIWGRENE